MKTFFISEYLTTAKIKEKKRKKQNSNAKMETFYQQSEIRGCRKPYYVNHTSLSGCGLYLLYHVFDEESKGGKKRLFLEYKP